MPDFSRSLVSRSGRICLPFFLLNILLIGCLTLLTGCADEPVGTVKTQGVTVPGPQNPPFTPQPPEATPTPVIKIGPEPTVPPTIFNRPTPVPLVPRLALNQVYSTGSGQPKSDQTQGFHLGQNGKLLVTGGITGPSFGGQLAFWNTQTGKISATLAGTACSETIFALSPDSKWLACQDRLQNLNLWQIPLANPVQPFKILHAGSNDQLSSFFITGLVFSADSKRLVVLDSQSRLHQWDIFSGLEGSWRNPLGLTGQPILSPDGKWLSVLTENRRYNPGSQKLSMWQMPPSITDQQPLAALNFELAGALTGIGWSADSQTFTSLTYNGLWQRWELARQRELNRKQFYPPDKELGLAVFSPDGKRFATVQTTLETAVPPRTNPVEGYTGGYDYRIELWDSLTARPLATLKGRHARFEVEMANHLDGVNMLEFSQDGNLLAAIGGDGMAEIWEVAGGRLANSFLVEIDQIRKIQFSLDDKLILTSQYNSVKQYSVPDGKPLVARPVEPGSRVAFSQDGRQFVEARPEAVRIRDFTTDRTLLSFRLPLTSDEYLLDTAFNRAGNRLGLVTSQHVYICDPGRGGLIVATLTGNYRWLSFQFSPDGRYFANADYDTSTIKVWSLDDGKIVNELGKGLPDILLGFFSPDGRQLLGGTYGQFDIIWQISDGQEIARLSIERATSQQYLGFSADSKWLIGSRYEKSRLLWLYDTADQREVFNQAAQPGRDDFAQVLFSHDGRYLLTVPPDENFNLWLVTRL